MTTYTCPVCMAVHLPIRHLSRHLRTQHRCSDELVARQLVQVRLVDTTVDDLVAIYSSGEENVDTITKRYALDKGSFKRVLVAAGVLRSAKQERQTVGYKRRYAAGCVATLGVSNPSYSQTSLQRKRATYTARYGVPCLLQTPAVRANAIAGQLKTAQKAWLRTKATLMERYGVSNPGQLLHVRQLARDRQLAFFAGMDAVQRSAATLPARAALHDGNNWSSAPERRVRDIVLSTYASAEVNVFLFSYNYDIRIGRLLIEVNGDYWHANPACGYKADDELAHGWFAAAVWAKDARKELLATQAGYSVLTLWEKELKSMTDEEVLTTIQAAQFRAERKR